MKYEFKKWQINSGITDNGNNTASMYIIITTGIVGDTYGFIPSNIGSDVIKVSWSKDKTQNEIEQICQQEAVKYVATKYPNTK